MLFVDFFITRKFNMPPYYAILFYVVFNVRFLSFYSVFYPVSYSRASTDDQLFCPGGSSIRSHKERITSEQQPVNFWTNGHVYKNPFVLKLDPHGDTSCSTVSCNQFYCRQDFILINCRQKRVQIKIIVAFLEF